MSIIDQTEPKEAFHYKPPTKAVKSKYYHIFNLDKPCEGASTNSAFIKASAHIDA